MAEKNIYLQIGETVVAAMPPSFRPALTQEALTAFGKDIVDGLLKEGIYVNKRRGDPSGRW